MILDGTIWVCITFCLGATQHLRGHSWERSTASPIIQHEPFVVVWNLPTAKCQEHFGITLPLGVYGIVENKGNVFHGQNMTIFYKNKFGLYPYISPEGEWNNGGIPQNVNLKEHLEKASKEIAELLNPEFQGLAVVDWEEWRPLWRRNWGPKNVYRKASEQWVGERSSGLSPTDQSYLAEVAFEQAAQALMETTLGMGKELRPEGHWGFYRFPDCFNDNWEKEENYTGHCNAMEVQWNNQLMWLWKVSSALYPSIYLPPKLPVSYHQLYVHHRLKEALRVAQFSLKPPLPVIAYSRVSYRRSPRYLTEADLAYTIGESAALGATGVVLWGDLSYSHSPAVAIDGRNPLVSKSTQFLFLANVML
ncbi:hyaluronidase-3 isoform X2 [Rhineura floridana]|uniref:hyaluronidase-3 isoform X2 n=1 Tax=Rhineura floridana TaxID=261503 RepID=UPI002AC7F155|nr:hyaluronidase-3 isoform X2 [Rhineura floridana]